ncbi:MAG: putative metal-dependent hydrolase [Lentimonas sp.]|jgi:predicted metal-dependent hydrolase
MNFALTNDESVAVHIKRRKGARHLRLSLNHSNEAVVSVPWRCSDREALKFLEKQRGWLEAQLGRVPRARTLGDWLVEYPLLSGSGDRFTVRVETTDRLRADYTFDNGGAEIVLRLPKTSEDADAALLQLVKRFAKDAMTCRVAYHAKRLDLKFTKLSVRDQASRWGSCSSSGGISLNWRLVVVAPELQDYVILHELAHLTEMNHSRHFWALLDTYDTNRVAHEAALDEMTAEIMRVGRG